MNVLIIDYGVGNLGSVRRSFEKCRIGNIVVSDDYREIDNCSKMVLPGVGAFGTAMSTLRSRGWYDAIKNACEIGSKPILGICLGMQLLADDSEEINDGMENQGLGLIKGQVRHLERTKHDEKIPHVGWNEVSLQSDHGLFSNIKSNSDFYFVHSYHMIPENHDHIIGHTPYCGKIVSAVNKANIFGVQFHPEKSSKVGLRLIENFLKI